MTARIVAFLLLFASLQLGWQALHGTTLERWLVDQATVKPAAAAVNLLTPDARARAINHSVLAPGGGVNVLNGCEGVEALFLLLAAFAVTPLAWRARAIGMLAGVAVVFAVNQARILALFYAHRLDRPLFDLLHGTAAPIAVILLVAGYFYAWISFASASPAPAD